MPGCAAPSYRRSKARRHGCDQPVRLQGEPRRFSVATYERSAAYRSGCGRAAGGCAPAGGRRRARPREISAHHAGGGVTHAGPPIEPQRMCPPMRAALGSRAVARGRRRDARRGARARRGRPDRARHQPRHRRRRADGRRREPEHAGLGRARRGHRQGRVGPAQRGLGRGPALRRRRPGGARAPEVDARRARAGAARRRCPRAARSTSTTCTCARSRSATRRTTAPSRAPR